MIKIFLESDKLSHIACVTLYATNILARKSQFIYSQIRFLYYYLYKNSKHQSYGVPYAPPSLHIIYLYNRGNKSRYCLKLLYFRCPQAGNLSLLINTSTVKLYGYTVISQIYLDMTSYIMIMSFYNQSAPFLWIGYIAVWYYVQVPFQSEDIIILI